MGAGTVACDEATHVLSSVRHVLERWWKKLDDVVWQRRKCYKIIDRRLEVMIRDPDLAAALIAEGHVVVK